MQTFEYLQRMREFERTNLPFLKTMEDFGIVRAIGLCQERGEAVTVKTLLTLNLGSAATLHRRMAAAQAIEGGVA